MPLRSLSSMVKSELLRGSHKQQLLRLSTSAVCSSSDDSEFLHRSIVPTDHFQASLPRLPVPKLEESCRRYLAALAPLLTSEELKRSEKIVHAFRDGEGQRLQEALVAQDKRNKHTNYVSGPWFDMYLKDRRSVVLNHNPFMMMQDDPRAEYNDQLIRATNFVVSSMRFMKTMQSNILEPEVFHLYPAKSDNVRFRQFVRFLPKSLSWYGAYWYKAFPLDMSQYGQLFSSTRIPRRDKDELLTDASKRHLLVLRNGHMFVFDALDENGNTRPAEEIMANLQHILADKSAPPSHPLGYLTTMTRDAWSSVREELLAAGNAHTLNLVDTALFCLVFEDSDSVDPFKLSRLFLCGDAASRWFDKSFTLIVTKNGHSAVNFEHSWGDGVAVLRYVIEILKDSSTRPLVHPDTRLSTAVPLDVHKLSFNLSDSLKAAVDEAKESYEAATSKLDVDYAVFDKFGRDYIKQSNIGPDSFMQLAFQMAYYKLTGGKTAPTYESCSTAAFKHGRTETIRPATTATAKACQLFHQPASSRPSHAELKSALEECSMKHNQLTKEAAMGQGFDRHLLGLKQIAEQQGGTIPELYRDPSYSRINHVILSTSTLADPAVQNGAFAPVVPDGYGIGYRSESESLGCIVTAYSPATKSRPFLDCLVQSFEDLGQVLSSDNNK